MKKVIAFTLGMMLILSLGITAFAAGTDDGVLTVATADGKKYFGSDIGDNVTEFTAADGSGDVFYDLTADKSMNICDLVALVKNEADINGDGAYTSYDAALIRSMLID